MAASLNKSLIHDHLTSLRQNTDIPTLRSFQAEQTDIYRVISDVSNKLDDLASHNKNLQKQIEHDAFEMISHIAAPRSESPATAVLSITDELADRECKKHYNLSVY